MEKIDIINETIEFYSKDPEGRRSMANRDCAYNGIGGNHCAIGRCFMSKFKRQGASLEGNTDYDADGLAAIHNVGSLDKLLSPKYRGHSLDFWSSLQSIHDSERNWHSKGLTDIGLQSVAELKERYERV